MAMTRAQLNQAFREVAAMEFMDIPCEETQIDFSFSEQFIKKMEKLIARLRKPYWEYVNTAAKRVAIVAILFISIIMTISSNDKVRASMLQWCEDVNDEYLHYFFEGETTKVIEYEYKLTVIPEGFEKVYEQRDSENVVVGYESETGDYIQYEQHATEDYEVVFDNEQMQWRDILIDNKEVRVYEHSDLMGAIWIEDGYAMNMVYYGCKDIEIIFEMISAIE